MEETVPDYDNFKVTTASGSNILGLVVFSCVFGIIIGRLGERGRPFYKVVASMQDGIIHMVALIIW